jgi:glycosyltransferase involved in cell wall biosynthesis
MKLTVLVPVYNDWDAVRTLIEELDRELASASRSAALIIVDDGSTMRPDAGEIRASALTGVEVLHLRRNLGHQRAIAVGLAYVEAQGQADAVVLMDGDGEDRPQDVNRLLDALQSDGASRIVFAERTRRSEGAVFSILYWGYRFVHRMLTGERVRVGNFSVIPRVLLRTLVSVSDLWNHYAAAVFHARLPFITIPTHRGSRYAGGSQMNFVSLVTHGLSAMSVFGDRIGVRLLLVACAITLVAFLSAVGFFGWQMTTGAGLVGWAPYAALALLLLVFLTFATSLGFVFIILAGRGTAGFLPFRDYANYISHTAPWPVSLSKKSQ